MPIGPPTSPLPFISSLSFPIKWSQIRDGFLDNIGDQNNYDSSVYASVGLTTIWKQFYTHLYTLKKYASTR